MVGFQPMAVSFIPQFCLDRQRQREIERDLERERGRDRRERMMDGHEREGSLGEVGLWLSGGPCTPGPHRAASTAP